MKVLRKSSLPRLKGQSFFDAFDEIRDEDVSSSDIGDLKWSKYNIVETYDDSVIVYNTASDGICRFDGREISGLFETDAPSDWGGDRAVTDALIKIGALVSKDVNEDLVLAMVRQNQLINPDNE